MTIDAGRSARARWGITRPTQPTMPDTATEHDTISVEAKMTTSRTRLVLMPIERASSSPNESTLSFQLSSN